MNEQSNLYLMHHGIKGMHWGVRRFQDENGNLTEEGKRRYAVQDARKYYKINRLQRAQEKAQDSYTRESLSKRIRKVQTRSDRKHADLSQEDINVGRQIVAKNRRDWAAIGTAAKAAATAAGAYALYKNPETRALAPLAVAGGAALTLGSAKKVPYYTMESRRYNQVNKKGSTNKGLSKNQQAIRKAGKIAATAAIAGATGYALYKSGAATAAVNAGKKALASRTGINFDKKSGKNIDKNSKNHNASKSIIAANKTATELVKKQTMKQERSAKRKEAAKTVASNVGNAVKNKVKSTLIKKVTDGIDANDPRTWTKAAKNVRNTISDVQRYGRAANNLRSGNAVGAAAEISDEITGTTNKIINNTKNRINNIKNKNKKKKGDK